MKSFLPIYLSIYTIISLVVFIYNKFKKNNELHTVDSHNHGVSSWIIRVAIILVLWLLLYLSGNV